jgi:hypothetical protein
VELLSREFGVPIFKLDQWRQKADTALDGALKEREADAASIELAAAMKRIRELSMEVERLARAHRETRPFGPQEVALMAEAISPTAGQPYGIQRVCRLWDVPRSSFYAAQVKSAVPATPPARRGPKPAISDEALLAAIKRDLETSPWTGEGTDGFPSQHAAMGPVQSLGPAARARWHPRLPQAAAARDARARPALAPPRPPPA